MGNKYNGILLKILLELLSFHTSFIFGSIIRNYTNNITSFYKFVSHKYNLNLPDWFLLVDYNKQLYSFVNYFLKKAHFTIKWPSLFHFQGNREESKYHNINKHSEFDLGSHAVAISAPTTQMTFYYTSHQRGMHHHTN